MKLTDLNPSFVNAGGEGIFQIDGQPSTRRVGIGLMFTCPCGQCDEDHDCYVDFANPLDGGPRHVADGPAWTRTGDSFETLTLTPSIHRVKEKGGCGWHGFITNGEVTSC